MHLKIDSIKRFLAVCKKMNVHKAVRPVVRCMAVHQNCGFTATNLQQDVRFGDTTGDPVFLLDIVTLDKVLKALPKSEETIEVTPIDGGKLKVGKLTLLAENVEEFPLLEEYCHQLDDDGGRDLDARFDLGNNRDQTIHLLTSQLVFVAKEKSRFAFNGAQLSSHHMCSTDGKRLLLSKLATTVKVEGPGIKDSAPIIPRAALEGVLVALKGDKHCGGVRVSTYDGKMPNGRTQFEVGDFKFRTQLVDGTFPQYKNVIPNEVQHTATVDSSALMTAVKIAETTCSPETHSVKLSVANDEIRVSSQSLSMGTTNIGVEAEVEGEIELALNPTFLGDTLKLADLKAEEKVTFGFIKNNQPVKLMLNGTRGRCDMTVVLMPVTTRNG